MTTHPPETAYPALRVGELHQRLGSAIREAGIGEAWVQGTVSGFRPGARFNSWELVEYEADATTVAAVLQAGAFPREMAAITQALRAAGVEFADGLEVGFFGRIETVASFGRLRLLARHVDPRVAVGATVLRRQALLAELEATGEARVQQLLAPPVAIRRLGLLSAATAAGRADVLSVLARSPVPIAVVEASAAMSGPAAPPAVAQALAHLQAERVDAIIIARGGGARSDLAAWDSSIVAHAIAHCRVPVLTALGHATDRTVADQVAHGAYETPSAAAAAVVAGVEALAHQAELADARLQLAPQADQVQQDQLARSRRRAAWAIAVAVVAVVLLLAVLLL